jgi:hypothetical protein
MGRPTNADIAARKKPESLEDFVNKSEDAARAIGLVVGHIEHPDAVTGTIFNGRFAGIRVTKAELSRALLSSGEWLD